MGKITQLNTQLSNMIAAGEVVERPQSVVKELVENSIDANSKNIDVILVDSGTKLINVVDDGDGMDKEDALLAFFRHATSKIKNEYDLFRINTLGFRGEAIPSIAAVSKFSLVTNQNGMGYEVIYNAGSKEKEGIVASNRGTNIKVSDIFYNTPARLKFLKSLSSELGSVSNLMTRFALCRPDIAFSLSNNKKTLLKTSGNNDLTRLFGEIYGFNVASNLIFKEYESNGYKIKLVLVKPSIYRANKNEITLVVNNRYVKNNHIIQAIIDGYKTLLPVMKYPIVCMYLDIDPLLIDVNVHPSKMVIKISNEDELRDILVPLIQDSLNNIALVVDYKEELEVYEKQHIFDIDNNDTYFNNEVKDILIEKPVISNLGEDVINAYNLDEEVYNYNEPIINNDVFKTEVPIVKQDIEIKDIKREVFPNIEYIGQLHGTYLLFQNETGLYLVDQHAACERINYEKYYNILKKGSNVSNRLLIALNIEFTKEEMLFIESNLNGFTQIGFDMELSSDNSYFIRSVPAFIDFDDIEDFIRELINDFVKDKEINIIKKRDRIAKQIACKDSIKANEYITKEAVQTLINNLRSCENGFTCPHGRPIFIRITNYELEKMFKRVM